MKKILFAAAVVALMASCAKNEVDNDISASKKIQFSSLNDRVTARSSNDNGVSYGVYAKWSGNLTSWFIAGAEIDDATDTSYQDYYWPTTGTVNFYAYAPYGDSGIFLTHTSEPAFSDGLLNYTAGDGHEDVTIADPVPGRLWGDGLGAVDLQFKHMLSKITVTAALSQELQDAGYTIMNSTTADVTVQKSTGTLNLTATTPGFTVTGGSEKTYDSFNWYNIIPQTSTDCSVQLKNVIIKNSDNLEVFSGALSIYDIKPGDITTPTADTFVGGYHYKLNFTIGNTATDPDGNPIFDKITFSSTPTPWNTPEGHDVGLIQP